MNHSKRIAAMRFMGWPWRLSNPRRAGGMVLKATSSGLTGATVTINAR